MAYEIERDTEEQEVALEVEENEEPLFDEIEGFEDEEQDEESEAQEEEAPVKVEYALPAYWGTEDKEEFEQLPEEAKAKFLALEKKRDAFTTRKSQELSAEKRKAESLGAVAQMLESDPKFREYVTSYGKQQAPAKEEGRPEDPIEAIKWEAKQELLAELTPQLNELKQTNETRKQREQVETVLAPYKADEHFADVYQGMNGVVAEVLATKGKAAADAFYQRLDSDPEFFGQVFSGVKTQLLKNKVTPQGKKITEKAPVLQGKGSPPQAPQSRKQIFTKARERLVGADGKVNAESVGDMLSAVFGDI